MIEQLLNNLNRLQRKQLLCAFEQGIAQYIVLDDGIFVGVNVKPLKNLEIVEESGDWAYGRLL